MITLGGNVCIRNAFELDYCVEECIKSLLPVCDTVTVCDGESTDKTQAFLRDWAEVEPKLRLCVYPWPNPKGDVDFWVKWINYNRGHIKTDFQFELDADEVLSEKSYDEILRFKMDCVPDRKVSLWSKRYNFWSDQHHLIPHGHCCSHRVVRIAPVGTWMPSDGPHPQGAACISMAIESGIEIFHYGFLRRDEAWFKKARAIHEFFFDSYDPRLKAAENYQGNWMRMPGISPWIDDLIPFDGDHPKIAHKWLNDRAYKV